MNKTPGQIAVQHLFDLSEYEAQAQEIEEMRK